MASSKYLGSFGSKFNFWAWLKNLLENDIGILTTDTTPVAGTSGSFVGKAGKGCVCIALDTGVWYTNTGTKASPTWTAM